MRCADPPAVHGLEGERLEDEEVERTAEDVTGWRLHWRTARGLASLGFRQKSAGLLSEVKRRGPPVVRGLFWLGWDDGNTQSQVGRCVSSQSWVMRARFLELGNAKVPLDALRELFVQLLEETEADDR